MRNPPGRHLLRVARAVGSSSALGGSGASTSATSPVAASSGGRPRARSGGRVLRATSPPPPSAIAAAACWESRALRRDGEEEDWEEVVARGEEAPAPAGAGEAGEDEYRVVFWSPPTGDEVRAALSSIEEVFENPFGESSYEAERQISLLSTSSHSSSDNSSGSDDWIEPAAYVHNSAALLAREHRNVLDAFRLLQKDPTVQKMVMSLSCDKAVWNAIMNNEAVQEFRSSFQDSKETDRKGSPGGPAGVLKWILGNTQAKIMEFFDKVLKIVNMLFHPHSDEEKPDLYSDAVKVSFMLSVFVFIVVAIARNNYEPWDFNVW